MAELRGIRHGYALPDGTRREVLRGIDLTLHPGGFHVILGRSGCGKSTLLRLMAGLERPLAGETGIARHSVGVVFQEPRLMPWLSVTRNVAFLIHRRLPAGEVARRTARALETVGLSAMRDALPDQLSGGMAQRVAIARALVTEPALLLMDEPFGALDAFTRKQMQDELVRIWQRLGTTIVFVTHDTEEAVRLAQTILVIEDGRFGLELALDLPHPRIGTEPAANAARQRLIEQLFTRPPGDLPDPAPSEEPS